MTAWSYSSLTAFETCPRRYELTRISKKITEPQTEATTHGNEVHKAIERAVKDAAPLPDKYKTYIPIVDAVRASPGVKHAEIKFGLTKSFTPTTFFANDVWCRGVLDLAVVQPKHVTVVDWKTGKPKHDGDQLRLFAAAAFSMYPFADSVRTGYAWLAYNKLDTDVFKREDVPELWGTFIPRVARMDEAIKSGKFPPRPSGLCKAWCPVPRSMCEFSGKSG